MRRATADRSREPRRPERRSTPTRRSLIVAGSGLHRDVQTGRVAVRRLRRSPRSRCRCSPERVVRSTDGQRAGVHADLDVAGHRDHLGPPGRGIEQPDVAGDAARADVSPVGCPTGCRRKWCAPTLPPRPVARSMSPEAVRMSQSRRAGDGHVAGGGLHHGLARSPRSTVTSPEAVRTSTRSALPVTATSADWVCTRMPEPMGAVTWTVKEDSPAVPGGVGVHDQRVRSPSRCSRSRPAPVGRVVGRRRRRRYDFRSARRCRRYRSSGRRRIGPRRRGRRRRGSRADVTGWRSPRPWWW